MVCPRCIMSVENLLKKEEIPFHFVQLGEIGLVNDLSDHQLKTLGENLSELGFGLLGDPSSQLIDRIKTVLIQKIQSGIGEHFSIQKFLTKKILKDYSSVSKLFSSVEGITIEQYFILQRIEKAKELLMYNEMSLSEIAWTLGYSSTQHLSAQFKRVTGMTPTQFKSLGNSGRKPIDAL